MGIPVVSGAEFAAGGGAIGDRGARERGGAVVSASGDCSEPPHPGEAVPQLAQPMARPRAQPEERTAPRPAQGVFRRGARPAYPVFHVISHSLFEPTSYRTGVK